MSDFSQTRSFNVGVSQETSIEAAMIYDDLVYAQRVFGKGFFFRSYEQMMRRFPMMSESTIRRSIKKLVDGKWISTKVMKVNGVPTCHFQIDSFLSVKMTDSMETVKMTDSINITTKETTKAPISSFSNPSISSFGEKKKYSAPADGPTGAPAMPLLQQLIDIINPREKATTERLRVLNGRLKDYSAQEITESANAFSKSEWHKENKQMSIDNLLAPSKFGRWYAIREASTEAKPIVTVENQDEMVRRRMQGGS